MSKQKQYIQEVQIEQCENGFVLMSGQMCNSRDRFVFQTMAELTKFLEDHFTHREDDIEIDSYSSSNN
jgi:hypothetical protein